MGNWKWMVVAVLLWGGTDPAWSRNAFVDSLNQRVEVKKKTRWTLADWLETKRKVNLMDMWLAANTSASLFEFYLGGSGMRFEDQVLSSPQALPNKGDSLEYLLGAYISIVGLHLEREEAEDVIHNRGEMHLRLLGTAEQSTRLNLLYGLQQTENPIFTETYTQSFWGGSLRMYLLSFFGIFGKYRQFLSAERPSGETLESQQLEYGGFFDLGPLQLSANLYKLSSQFSTASESQRTGLKAALRLYF